MVSSVMSPRAISWHPEALDEIAESYSWYRARTPDAATRFVREVTRAANAVADAPERWPADADGFRRYVLQRFPFLVVYRTTSTRVEILAIAHARRHRDYWRDRLFRTGD